MREGREDCAAISATYLLDAVLDGERDGADDGLSVVKDESKLLSTLRARAADFGTFGIRRQRTRTPASSQERVLHASIIQLASTTRTKINWYLFGINKEEFACKVRECATKRHRTKRERAGNG